jgi:GT2 family glycosyltransferase
MKCIPSIINQSVLPYELIVVDSSDERGLDTRIIDIFKPLPFKFIYKYTSVGLTHQRNVGVEIASGDYLFFFDDDVVLNSDYHQKVLNVYEDNITAMGVGGIVINERTFTFQQTLLRKAFFLPTASGNNNILPSGQLDYVNGATLNTIIKVDALFGCLFSFKKEVFDTYRFDENLSGYAAGEDVDFSYRVSRKFNLFLTPFAKAYHNPSHISNSKPKEFMRMLIINSFIFYKRNMDINIFTLFAFVWSQIGLLLYSIVQAIRKKRYAWFTGAIEAYYILIFRSWSNR